MPNLHLMRSSRSGGLPKLVSCLFFNFCLVDIWLRRY